MVRIYWWLVGILDSSFPLFKLKDLVCCEGYLKRNPCDVTLKDNNIIIKTAHTLISLQMIYIGTRNYNSLTTTNYFLDSGFLQVSCCGIFKTFSCSKTPLWNTTQLFSPSGSIWFGKHPVALHNELVLLEASDLKKGKIINTNLLTIKKNRHTDRKSYFR